MVVEVDFSLPVGLNWRFNQNVHVRARRNSPIFLNSLILVFIFINIYSITEQLSQRIKENRSSVEMHENKLFDAQIDKGKKKKKKNDTSQIYLCEYIHGTERYRIRDKRKLTSKECRCSWLLGWKDSQRTVQTNDASRWRVGLSAQNPFCYKKRFLNLNGNNLI